MRSIEVSCFRSWPRRREAHYLVGSARRLCEVPAAVRRVRLHRAERRLRRRSSKEMTDAATRAFEAIESTIVRDDANGRVREICRDWDVAHAQRAVLVPRPVRNAGRVGDDRGCGRALSAIDMWYLFPVGAVCRLHAQGWSRSSPGWEERLDARARHPRMARAVLRGVRERRRCWATSPAWSELRTYQDVCEFFTQRLKGAFADVVAGQGTTLQQRKGSPMFLLFFAVANPSARTARRSRCE